MCRIGRSQTSIQADNSARKRVEEAYNRDSTACSNANLRPKNRNPNRRRALPHAEPLGIEAPGRRCLLNPHPNPELDPALVEFSEESSSYCKGINDDVAREYATQYARMIEQLLKGIPPGDTSNDKLSLVHMESRDGKAVQLLIPLLEVS